MAELEDKEFITEFGDMGHPLPAENIILFDKMRELCALNKLDATDLCAKWVAFVKNKKLELKVTSDNLDLMERESNRKTKHGKTSVKVVKPASTPIYNKDTFQELDEDNVEDDLLGAYSTPNNKAKKKRQHTPDQPQNKRLTNMGRSAGIPFSPTSFSPATGTPSQKYDNRKNSNEVVVSFGDTSKAQWKSSRATAAQIRPFDEKTALTTRFKYMFQKMADKAHVLNDLIEDMGEFLKCQHNIEADYSHIGLPAQEQVSLCGRVCCDSNGKLNAQSVVLEGSRETSAGKHIPVELSELQHYSLFPGQLVVMEGTNITGNKVVAKKMFDNVPLPIAPTKEILPDGAVNIVVAAGPFTTADSPAYDPLRDLMTYLHNSSPDVCIMLGPFIDAKNPEIEKQLGNISYEDFFNETIVKKIEHLSKNINTQIVLVPSQRDVHAFPVYPQPPFKLSIDPKLPQHQNVKRLHCVSDPCTLDIDGVVLGLTSTDILFHLGNEEIANNAGPSDRLSRLTKHILTQHCYYPLYPAAEEVNVDYEQLEIYGKLPVTPHVLVVPSDLRYFIKDIAGCCCVNPGRLAKGQAGGTYARLVINPPNTNSTLTGTMAGEVVKI